MSAAKIDGARGINALVKKFVTVYCSTAVTKGDVVIYDGTDVVETTDSSASGGGIQVKKATANADLVTAVGVAAETITAAGYVRIQVAGFCDSVTAQSAVAAGKMVGTSATAGRVDECAAWTQTAAPFAMCVNAIGAGAADGAIMIIDKGFFYHE